MANAVVQQINAEMEELQKQLSQFKSSVEYLNNAKSQVSKAVDAVNKAEDNFIQRVKELKDTYHSFIQLSDAVWAVIQKIDTVNFPERLDNLQATVKETIKNLNEIKEATITEVQKAANAITKADFDGKFSSLQKGLDTSVKSNEQLADGIQKMKLPEKIDEFEKSINKRLSESYKEIERNTKQIADDTSKAIMDLNLPIRIDKLDANIAGISSAIQNVQGRLDLLESNVKDRLREASDRQSHALSSFQDKLFTALEKESKQSSMRYKRQKMIHIIIIAAVVISFISLFFLKK
jgi:ABC-type transporter Mla subunit MlaD